MDFFILFDEFASGTKVGDGILNRCYMLTKPLNELLGVHITNQQII